MFKLEVSYQSSYSRLKLLLRIFFGGLYIVFPHFIVLFFVLIWAKLLWLYATFYILLKGEYPMGTKMYLEGVLRWLSRLHLSAYNLTDEYPMFGVKKEVDYLTIKFEENEEMNRLLVLFKFLFAGLIILPHLFIWTFRNVLNGILTFVAFWVVLFTGKYPQSWFDFSIGTLRWLIRVVGYQLYLVENYPPFSGKE